MYKHISKWICVFLIALSTSFVGGFVVGRNYNDGTLHLAIARRDEADQLDAAQAYLRGVGTSQLSTFVSVASGRVWGERTLQSGLGKWLDAIYRPTQSKARLRNVSNFRIGPPIGKTFLNDAAPYELGADSARVVETGRWPDWRTPPRFVFYDSCGTTYVLFVVKENGGWHVLGTPLGFKREWLARYKSYSDAVSAEMGSKLLIEPEQK
jgi:hypothetical protein